MACFKIPLLSGVLTLCACLWSIQNLRLEQCSPDDQQSKNNCERSKDQLAKPVGIEKISLRENRAKAQSERRETDKKRHAAS